MKYRKKPVEIEAIQFADDPDTLIKINDVLGLDPVNVSYEDPDNPVLKIPTLEGVMTAQVGDYIIKGVHGEFYPCKPDIFEETYEPSIGLPIDISKAKCISISTHELAEILGKPIEREVDKQSRRERRRKGFL
ncbi:hypothetical protein [Lacticaseibacillus paracasei]|uniref:hypothetical protein n=1 Tax=Lacticaseibacillus paracasei TaxID=1597 RepID=UPI0025A0C490|nr:hypothetical protein [Lacticaseibacillus paracasei]MDM7529985.1 hypothetical protein [Lacticaseibacillus paracasei]MDM7542089.1 hypothetical protein [Lacticaseibacillus paracasei]